jgi:hypothetical protein
MWDSFSMSPGAGREVPLHYTQLGNPGSELDMGTVEKPKPEVR